MGKRTINTFDDLRDYHKDRADGFMRMATMNRELASKPENDHQLDRLNKNATEQEAIASMHYGAVKLIEGSVGYQHK